MLENKIISFASKFGIPERFNSQFHKVKIYVAYAGKNRNGSIISKETFEKMIPSIYGIPIVGEWKGEDFGSHGGRIEISEDGIDFIDTTKPYGYVDSSARVEWETVAEEDGVERDYLVVDGYLWTSRYPESLNVLNGQNNQSMEINVFDGKISEEDQNYFEITSAEFSALCILGEAVQPCFESARVSQFNLDKETFKSEFTVMVKELKESLNFSTQTEETIPDEGGEVVEDEIIVADEVKTEDKFVKVFELSHSDIRSKLYTALQPLEDESDTWFWILDVYDDYFIYEDEMNAKYYKQEYIKTDVDVALNGERVEVFMRYLTTEEIESLNQQKAEFDLMKEEIVSLKEFKAQKDQEAYELQLSQERQEKIDYINNEFANIPQEVRDEFIARVDEYDSKESIEADMCVYVVKNKVKFSKGKENKQIKIGLEPKETVVKMSPYGDLFNK